MYAGLFMAAKNNQGFMVGKSKTAGIHSKYVFDQLLLHPFGSYLFENVLP